LGINAPTHDIRRSKERHISKDEKGGKKKGRIEDQEPTGMIQLSIDGVTATTTTTCYLDNGRHGMDHWRTVMACVYYHTSSSLNMFFFV
jgi:hypothetical protein